MAVINRIEKTKDKRSKTMDKTVYTNNCHCLIAKLGNYSTADKSAQMKYIYCHCNGHIENNGKYEGVGTMLKNHYNDNDKTEELLNLGNISFLRPNLNPTTPMHGFGQYEDDVTAAYIRDWHRSPYNDRAKTESTGAMLLLHAMQKGDASYLYVRKNHKWYAYNINEMKRLHRENNIPVGRLYRDNYIEL